MVLLVVAVPDEGTKEQPQQKTLSLFFLSVLSVSLLLSWKKKHWFKQQNHGQNQKLSFYRQKSITNLSAYGELKPWVKETISSHQYVKAQHLYKMK